MKKSVFFLFILYISFVQFSKAQIIAGSPSAGLIISDPNINLSVSTVGNTVSGIFDLDCDSVADMRVDLYKGPTAIDGANMAYLYVLNPLFEICADTGTTTLRDVYYFNLGDTLVSPDSTYWASDSIYKLGDFGCMDCPGPYSVSNLFIAYRNTLTSQVGWIKISFSLFDPSPILSIPEILSPCLNTELPMGGGGLSGTGTCGIFTYSYTITPPTCDGACDGIIEITGLSGGTPSYTYLWNDPGMQTVPTATSLCSGTYSVNFTDAVGNTCFATFVLPNGPAISFNFNVTNPSCFGNCDATICSYGVSGGSAPYMYLWMTGAGAVTSPCFYGACTGTYTLCVTDANGCQTCSTVVVSDPTPMVVTASVVDASCSTCCDGNATINVTGGNPLYTYSWSSGCTSAFCGSLCPGVYNYCVTDVQGCTSCDSIVVSFPLSSISLESDYAPSISPNPNNGNFEIVNSSSTISDVEIKITDVNGKLILQKVAKSMNQKVELNTAIQNGVYFVYLHDLTSTQITVKKLVIQKQ